MKTMDEQYEEPKKTPKTGRSCFSQQRQQVECTGSWRDLVSEHEISNLPGLNPFHISITVVVDRETPSG